MLELAAFTMADIHQCAEKLALCSGILRDFDIVKLWIFQIKDLENRVVCGLVLTLIRDKWKVLTAQLRQMEATGLLERKVYAEVPPRVKYTLTPLGYSLKLILEAMWTWGEEYQASFK